MKTEKIDDGIIIKESYPWTCPGCSHEQRANPSMGMKFGMMNSGHGACLECKLFCHLEIDLETNEKMNAEDFEKWAEKIKAKKK